jgi:hypothetical protein
MDAEVERLRGEVLGLLEADSVPVQEVWWAANSLFPELALSHRLAMAEDLVRLLVEERAADLCRSPFPDPELAHEGPVPVAGDELDDVLRSWSTWITSEEAVLLRARVPVRR